MRGSYREIGAVLERCRKPGILVLEGATDWLRDDLATAPWPATENLIARTMASEGRPLYVVAIGVYVVAIGAPTNVSSSLALAPEILERIVVVWLGGNALWWPTAREFNLEQDLMASQLFFDSGVTMVHVPCLEVADHVITSRPEVEQHVRPADEIGEFLADRYVGHVADDVGVSKVIWDMPAVGWILNDSWTRSRCRYALSILQTASRPTSRSTGAASSSQGKDFVRRRKR